MLCAVITGPSFEEVLEQIEYALKYADVLEFRVDFFTFSFIDFKINFNIPFILTLNSKSKLLAHMSLKPDYVDLGYTTDLNFIKNFKKLYPSVKIILSYHDFERTVEDLESLLHSMQNKPADFYKIACHANSSLDALRMLKFLQNCPLNVIGLCMGEYGAITRIINHWSYGCVNQKTASATGQLTIESLVNDYNFKSFNKETKIYALIGNPINKSVSHITHNRFFKSQKYNAIYVKIGIKREELEEFFKAIKDLPFHGLSVTMPLKQAVIPYLDEIDKQAKQIFAVNTIVIKDNKLIGFNTDCIGALLAIEEKTAVGDKKILIIGAGGAARAIAFACRILKEAHVTVINRNLEKAIEIANDFHCEPGSLHEIAKYTDYDILINCTPLEMPIEKKYIPKKKYVMDICSRRTEFLDRAESNENTPIAGFEMFFYQAIRQFELWFDDFSYCKRQDLPSLRELFNVNVVS